MTESIVSKALDKHEEKKEKGKEKPRGKTIDEVDEEELEAAPEDEELRELVDQLKVNIKIFGAGGGGSNTLDRLTEEGITGGELIAVNTDAKHLLHTHAQKKELIGKQVTSGLGAGARPEIGEKCARQSKDKLKKHVDGADIVFLTAGMGGGTGTGSAPIIADLANDEDALVMGVVTLPFEAEGKERMRNAKRGLMKLEDHCHTTVVIPNDKLLELVPDLPINKAFKVADEILMESIKGMTEIITKPGLVNIDYNDMRTIMDNGELAMIGIGESDDPNSRIEDAVEQALGSPLLGEVDVSESKGALVRVMGGPNMTVSEAEKAANMVNEKISKDARIIWGCNVEEDMSNEVKILLVITNVHTESEKFADEMMATPDEEIDSVT
ncbi:MAG: cell division protein FtsZ [Candidatus Thermoplasmatota archaeon]